MSAVFEVKTIASGVSRTLSINFVINEIASGMSSQLAMSKTISEEVDNCHFTLFSNQPGRTCIRRAWNAFFAIIMSFF